MSTISISDSLASVWPATSLKWVSQFCMSYCLALLLAKPNTPPPPSPPFFMLRSSWMIQKAISPNRAMGMT